MDWFLGYIIAYVIEGVIGWQYLSNIFERKCSRKKVFFSYVIGYGLLLAASPLESIIINFIGFFLVNVCLLRICYRVSKIGMIFHSLILSVIMSVGELIGFGILGFAIPGFEVIPQNKMYFLLNMTVSKMLYLFVSRIVVIIWGKKKSKITSSNGSLFLVTIVPVLSIYVLVCFFRISIEYSVHSKYEIMFILSAVFMLVINLLTFWMFTHNEKIHNNVLKLELQNQRERDDTKYYKVLVDRDDRQRIFLHDIKSHLFSIRSLAEIGKRDEAIKYIDDLCQSSELLNNKRYSGNPLLNSIINRYGSICKENGISLSVKSNDRSINYLTDSEITALFSNLIGNAVEAAGKVENGFVELRIILSDTECISMIQITNSCESEPEVDYEGKLISTKDTQDNHGFGMRSIQKIIDTYDGYLMKKYDKDEQVYEMVVFLNTPYEYKCPV